MSINDATPADWDRLRKIAPAVEKTGLEHWGTAVSNTPDDMVNHPNH